MNALIAFLLGLALASLIHFWWQWRRYERRWARIKRRRL